MTFSRLVCTYSGESRQLHPKAIAFWTERGFTFSPAPGELWVGQRGSLWGNLTSSDMSKVRATLTVASIDSMTLSFLMEIDTSWQWITDMNKAYWHLELATAESWLLHGDKREADWREYKDQCRKSEAAFRAYYKTLDDKTSPMR